MGALTVLKLIGVLATLGGLALGGFKLWRALEDARQAQVNEAAARERAAQMEQAEADARAAREKDVDARAAAAATASAAADLLRDVSRSPGS